jgi:hypothetical protein
MSIFASAEAQQAVYEIPCVVEREPGQIDFWNVEATGHSDTDIALGEQCAGMCLALARKFQMPLLIAMCLRDMCLAGKFTGVEAGFCASIASAARVGSYN